MLAKILIAAGLVATGLLLIIITTTTPTSAGAVGILAVFLLSYIVLLCLLTFVVWLLGKILHKIRRKSLLFRNVSALSFRKAYYYASVIALGPIIIVSLQSVGGVSLYSLGLVGVFIVLGCIYVSRRTV